MISLHQLSSGYNNVKFHILVEIAQLLSCLLSLNRQRLSDLPVEITFHQEVFSMRIQEALSNCCQTASQTAATVATWAGHQVSVVAQFLGEAWEKVSAFVASAWEKLVAFAGPQLEKARNFAVKNQASIIIGLIGAVIGGALVAACSTGNSSAPRAATT